MKDNDGGARKLKIGPLFPFQYINILAIFIGDMRCLGKKATVDE